MNSRKARQLRKEAGYHPGQSRDYHIVNKSKKRKDATTFKSGTIELQDTCSRVLYQELKKEYYGSK